MNAHDNTEARMPLAGDLDGFSIGEVILFIMRGAKTGRLVLRRDTTESSIFFEGGVITSVAHSHARGAGALSSALAAFSSGQFEFHEGEHAALLDMHVDVDEFTSLAVQEKAEADTIDPVLPELDEKLTATVSFETPLSLTPLQWTLLAQMSHRRTLRHLSEGRDLLAVKKALAPLLVNGLVHRTGEMASADVAVQRLVIVKGYTREEEAVEVDTEIIAGWRDAGVFAGKVTIGGHVFVALPKQGLGRSIVMSAPACRLCGVRDGQEIEVAPAH
jgi:hypothetical protein